MNSASAARARPLLIGLLIAGLGGAAFSPIVLQVAVAIIIVFGVTLWRQGALSQQGWDAPKELRLIHFAFWFFVLTSLINWISDGLPAVSFERILAIILLALFWPLSLSLAVSKLRARHLFAVFAVASLASALTVLFSVDSTTPDAVTLTASQSAIAIRFAVLTGLLSLVGALHYVRTRHRPGAALCALSGIAALLAALVSPQVQAVTTASPALTLIVQHGLIASAGWLGLLFIPAVITGPHLRSRNPVAVSVALAGLTVSVVTLVYGVMDSTIIQPAYLTGYLLLMTATATTLFMELDLGYQRTRKVRVSATIITMNEADNIEDCLRSARAVADEIIVLDSGSSDDTVVLARPLADIVEVTDWPGFGIQKQRALDRATGDWVLSLDADERITEALAREINDCLAEPDADAYKLPWAVTIYGKRLDFGRSGRAPLRLFRREGVRFSDALVHERILIPEGRRTRTLRGRLTHYTHRDFGHSLEKSAKYAWLGSLEKGRKGKKTRTMVYPTLRGLLTFVQVYFIRFGFLDGAVGYLTAVTYAQVTFNKYAGLWTLGRDTDKAK